MAVTFVCRTLIVFSVARLRSIIEPYSTPEAGAWVIRRTILIEILLLVLAILYSLSYLVTHYYFLAHDDGISTMQDLLTPGLLRWYTLQNDAEVSLDLMYRKSLHWTCEMVWPSRSEPRLGLDCSGTWNRTERLQACSSKNWWDETSLKSSWVIDKFEQFEPHSGKRWIPSENGIFLVCNLWDFAF